MNPISPFIEALGLEGPWTYLALFLGASLFMIWRLEVMGSRGLEGTALGTVIMPFCSGLGNLLFVLIVHQRGLPGAEIATNALVNNMTNLTLLIGLPAVLFGLSLDPAGSATGRAGRKRRPAAGAATARRLNRLSLVLTLAAGFFFTATSWILGRDGCLDAADGGVLAGVFLFWIMVQVFDVMKYNVHRNRTIPPAFYFDLILVLLSAGVLYTTIDWLVAWIDQADLAGLGVGSLGWLSGLLMVVPNGLIAFYYAARRRAEVVYASQVGDGHICIPLCLGLAAMLSPVELPPAFLGGLVLLGATFAVHLTAVMVFGGLPRWAGWGLLAGYAAFFVTGFGA